MTRVLLCSVGHSSMVVPEAFYFSPDGFDEVHVFTTDSGKFDDSSLCKFFDSLPQVRFSITKSSGVADILNEQDFSIYQELLWKWYLKKMPEQNLPFVCLSGGIKSMSASLQKAASLFGAQSVFHVLADNNPKSLDEMHLALQKGEIHYIEMGYEPGWEVLRRLKDILPSLSKNQDTGNDKATISKYIDQILSNVRIAASGSAQANQTPFPSLTVLPPIVQQWLQLPLSINDLNWIRSLPKVDLHCHLGGFATSGFLLEDVRQAALDFDKIDFSFVQPEIEGWPRPVRNISLETYMLLGNTNGTRLLKDRGCLIRQVELLYQSLVGDNVVYAEIRCSPNNYSDNSQNRSAWIVLQDIRSTLSNLISEAKSQNKSYCHINLLVIASRKTSGDLSDISRHLSLAITAMQQPDNDCKVVGVDLAGFENRETRASYFEHDFKAAHRCGLAVTAHAGENDDPEGIWQAVYTLHARRLGHALNLAEAPDLMRTVIERKIGVEMCPYANYQIKGFAPMPYATTRYPLKIYLDAGVLVSVNTDNIGISGASLSENLLFLSELCPGISRMDVLTILRNSIETAFITHEFRTSLLSYLDKRIYNACLLTVNN